MTEKKADKHKKRPLKFNGRFYAIKYYILFFFNIISFFEITIAVPVPPNASIANAPQTHGLVVSPVLGTVFFTAVALTVAGALVVVSGSFDSIVGGLTGSGFFMYI